MSELPYDYRTALDDNFGQNHQHGPPNQLGFDRHGHFGKVSDSCDGRVIHYVTDQDIVFDDSSVNSQ